MLTMKQFDGQHADEEVLFVFRRHIITMRKGFYGLLIPFVIFSLPILLLPLVPFQLPSWMLDPYTLLMISGIGLGIGMLVFLWHWVAWYFSYFIVSNQRLRQVNQTAWFGKSVIDLSLTKIQNISYTIEGFTATVFKFGTIVVQTYVGDLVLDKIYHPEEIYNNLQDAVHAAPRNNQEINEENQAATQQA